MSDVIFSERTENGDPSFWFNDIKDNDNIYVTMHAAKRLKERTGWNKKAAARMLEKVQKYGIREDKFTGLQKKLVFQIYHLFPLNSL